MSDDHIHQTRFCRDEEIFDHTAIVQHADLKSTGIGDDVFIHLIAVLVTPKGLERNCAIRLASFFIIFGQGSAAPTSSIIMVIAQFSRLV